MTLLSLYNVWQTYLLAMYRTSQSSHEKSQLYLSGAQYVTFWPLHAQLWVYVILIEVKPVLQTVCYYY